jgi:hypothetical protein
MNVASREMKVVRTINDFFMESILGRVHGLTKTYANQTTLFALATVIPGISPRQETLYSLTFHYVNPAIHVIKLRWGKAYDFDVYEDTLAVTVGLEKQAKSGIAEAIAPQIVS